MKTLVFRVDSHAPDTKKIKIAAGIIKKGGLVAFPTETVYGLGANALNAKAVTGLFKAKNRPFDNPPIVHVCDQKDVAKLAIEVPSNTETLIEEFWPGPLTLILKCSKRVPKVTVAGLDTIAVRMPKHNVALALIEESQCPISAPSANLAGKPSPTSAQHVLHDLNGEIDVVLDGGPTRIGVESTVLDLTANPPQILRPGGITLEKLRKVLGRVVVNPQAITDKPLFVGKIRSPGTKHKHYAPNAEMILVEGDTQAIVDNICELVDSYKKKGKKVGILATDETFHNYRADLVKSLGGRSDLRSIAGNLFRLLREFDEDNVDVIIAEGVPSNGLGMAIMNRLRKAAGHRIVKAKT